MGEDQISYNGSGTFQLAAGNPVVSGTNITITWANGTLSDIASGMSNALCKDGQSTPTANLKMGSYKFTGLGAGSARTDSLNIGQLQDGALIWLGTGAGTADVITATATPSITAYAAGQTFRFVSSGANTGAVTLNIDTLGAKSVTKNGTTALAAGDIPSGAVCTVVYDGTRFQLLNVVGGNFATDVNLAAGKSIVFEGTTDDAYEVSLSGGDPTADRTIALPDKSGTLATDDAASTSAKGLVELADATEARALSDALKAITPSTLKDAFTGTNQSIATPGYQKLPGGLIVQWLTGTTSGTAGNGVNHNFPIAFPTACLGVLISPFNQTVGSGSPYTVAVATSATTQFASQASASSIGFFAVAIGY